MLPGLVKTEMATQKFEPDEWDKDTFVWKEHAVKPGFARPVMIHRAILGSVERFMAILIEHLGGKWPFFLSPRQIMIVPISKQNLDYCDSVYLYLHKLGYQVQVDHSNNTLKNMIRIHQTEQYNFILCAGQKEQENGTVDIRTRENKRVGVMRVDKLHGFF